ncbi:MAG: hypothetical protein HYU64_04425 [Armatimonadetes bacterium]|nr:hypothetical protein [Armatimonadota bacterium]
MNTLQNAVFTPGFSASLASREARPRQSEESATVSAKSEDNDITIGQAASGLTGAAAGAVIETVGNTASSVVNLPRGVYHAYKAVIKTDMIGPVLKASLCALIPVAAAAVPVLTALGSAGYGFYHGFAEGVENGVKSAVKETARDVKFFHTEISDKAVEALQQIETEHLPEGQEPYDIKIIEAAKGLTGAAVGAVVDGVGAGAITLVETPKGVYKAYKALLTSDSGPVIKTTGSLLVPPAAILAAPVATVGGGLYGLYKGFGDAYRDGVITSAKNRIEDLKSYAKFVNEGLDQIK